MNVINKNKYIHAAIVLLLIVCIIINAAIPARAELALTTGIIAVVGTILVASGMSFDSDSSMTAAAKNFWKSLDDDTKKTIGAIADQYADFITGNPLQKFVFKISKPVVSAVAGWLSGLGVSADSTSVDIPVSSVKLPMSLNWNSIPYLNSSNWDRQYSDFTDFLQDHLSFSVQIADQVYLFKSGSDSSSLKLTVFIDAGFSGYTGWGSHTSPLFITVNGRSYHPAFMDFNFTISTHLGTHAVIALDLSGVQIGSTSSLDSSTYDLLFPSSSSGTASIPIAPDYIPAGSGTKPLDSDCDIVLPSGLVKTGTGADTIDSDLVGTMTPDSVRDTSTDVDVPDTGILSGIRDLVGDIAGAITGTLSDLLTGIKTGIDSIATTLGNFFDVSQFELDFSPFQIGLTKIFPFCIPFDFFNGIKLFAQQADNFSFDIKLDTDYFKIDHSVDLSHFKVPFAFFRFVAVFWFSYILISRTRDFMKW